MATKPTSPNAANKAGVKANGPRAAKAKAAAVADPVVAGEGEGDAAAKGVAGLRLKQLVDRVVAATGGKKKGVKEIVEATLLQMGEALKKGENLNLPAFGKVRIARQAAEGTSGAMTLKMRQGGGAGGGAGAKAKAEKEALADAADQD